jgi:HEPN domain-containing protein
MLAMYDEKEILREYIEYEKYHAAKEAAQEATKKATKETVIKLIKAGRLSIEDIPQFFTSLTPEDIKEIENELMQTV